MGSLGLILGTSLELPLGMSFILVQHGQCGLHISGAALSRKAMVVGPGFIP